MSSRYSQIHKRLPRFAQVLADDMQNLHEYGRFMRVAMTVGTLTFLYKFSQTMAYMESEKREETFEERADRKKRERVLRDRLRDDALQASSIVPPSDEHIRQIIHRANS